MPQPFSSPNQWRVSCIRHAHDTVSCALLHVANLHRMCLGLHHAVSRGKLEMHVRRKKKAIAVELKKNCLKTCTPRGKQRQFVCWIQVKMANGKIRLVKCLIDNGSQVNLVRK